MNDFKLLGYTVWLRENSKTHFDIVSCFTPTWYCISHKLAFALAGNNCPPSATEDKPNVFEHPVSNAEYSKALKNKMFANKKLINYITIPVWRQSKRCPRDEMAEENLSWA